MRYLRFIVPPTVLSLVFAFMMPLCGMTLATGMTGMLASIALGCASTFWFAGCRHAEQWVVKTYAKDKVDAYNLSQLTVLICLALGCVLLGGISWLLPQYMHFAQWSGAVLGGFWLTVIGLALSPAPALILSYKQSGNRNEPKPEAQVEPKPEAQVEPKPEAQAEPKPEAQAEPKPEAQAEPKPDAQVEPKPDAQLASGVEKASPGDNKPAA